LVLGIEQGQRRIQQQRPGSLQVCRLGITGIRQPRDDRLDNAYHGSAF
jgi:hypothetical protein